MQFTNFQERPGAISYLVPEGLRNFKIFQLVTPLIDDMFINDVRKMTYDKFDGFWDPFASSSPLVIAQMSLGFPQDKIKKLFTKDGVYDEAKLRLFLYYLPLGSGLDDSLEWYSLIIYLKTGQIVKVTSGDNCTIIMQVPENGQISVDEAKQVLEEILAAKQSVCTDALPPIEVKPKPDTEFPKPGC